MNQDKMENELYKKHFRVAIFGSARIKENDSRFNEVYQLAKLIAAENIDIVTGGGPGIMKAASQGHQDGRISNDSHAIGLNIQMPLE